MASDMGVLQGVDLQGNQAGVDRILADLVTDGTGVVGALLATDDGYVVSQVLDDSVSGKTLSAVSASLLGLSESAANVVDQGVCRNVIVESERGMMVSLRVGDALVLSVLAASGTGGDALLAASKGAAGSLVPLCRTV